jgi:SAM-dependent methyltransferase
VHIAGDDGLVTAGTKAMLGKTHEQRIQEQIRQYANTESMHGQLADIFRYWSQTFFKQRFKDVCRADNHLEFYAHPLAERVRRTGLRDVISFGSGDAQVEVGVATVLKREGVDDFRFHCVELSPKQIERAEGFVAKAGLSQNFVFVEADFNTWEPGGQVFAGAMCHHALHHVQDLEHLAGAIHEALHPDGAFASIDVIGRNGHMRWPEALEVIERIWNFLPDSKKYHHILKSVDLKYRNRDCSNQGFEGIRSQDILPVLMQNFGFESFLGFGNLIDVFTSRGFGANFDAEDEHDRAFIEFIEFLNELLIDLGHIKPTRMCAVMVKGEVGSPRTYKNWTPAFCVREPG